jgi:predicted DNA-binding protein
MNEAKYTDEQWMDMAEEVLSQDLSDVLAADDGTTPVPPPAGETMVVRSLRLPLGLHMRINALAEQHGVPASTLMRQWISEAVGAMEDDEPISRADAMRALRLLRRLPRAA